MLTELRLEDFPGWEGKEPIRLAPITLFFGPNGSGKSALLQAVCDKAAGSKPRLSARRVRRGDEMFEEVLGHWLTVMGIIDDFSVATSMDDAYVYGLKVRVRASEAYVPVIRAGSGTVRALVVLVGAFGRATTTPIHLDHPESHLHPCAQSALGDALLSAAQTAGTQLLVETNSERLLRRIQRRIAEGQVTSDILAAYLVESRDGKPDIQELTIDEHGSITNWPADFFGDEVSDLIAMAEATARRPDAPNLSALS